MMPPDLLPSISDLRRTTQSLAMLDAIFCPDWEYRYYSFNSRWGAGGAMASMRNGQGDDWFLLFDGAGAALKGFAHALALQNLVLAQQVQRQVPQAFQSFLGEPAFSMQDVSFCYWCAADGTGWHKVSGFVGDDDGAQEMLALLAAGPSGYREWAEAYYEVPVPLQAVAAIFAHEPLTEALVRALAPDADLEAVHADADEIGYPLVTAA